MNVEIKARLEPSSSIIDLDLTTSSLREPKSIKLLEFYSKTVDENIKGAVSIGLAFEDGPLEHEFKIVEPMTLNLTVERVLSRLKSHLNNVESKTNGIFDQKFEITPRAIANREVVITHNIRVVLPKFSSIKTKNKRFWSGLGILPHTLVEGDETFYGFQNKSKNIMKILSDSPLELKASYRDTALAFDLEKAGETGAENVTAEYEKITREGYSETLYCSYNQPGEKSKEFFKNYDTKNVEGSAKTFGRALALACQDLGLAPSLFDLTYQSPVEKGERWIWRLVFNTNEIREKFKLKATIYLNAELRSFLRIRENPTLAIEDGNPVLFHVEPGKIGIFVKLLPLTLLSLSHPLEEIAGNTGFIQGLGKKRIFCILNSSGGVRSNTLSLRPSPAYIRLQIVDNKFTPINISSSFDFFFVFLMK